MYYKQYAIKSSSALYVNLFSVFFKIALAYNIFTTDFGRNIKNACYCALQTETIGRLLVIPGASTTEVISPVSVVRVFPQEVAVIFSLLDGEIWRWPTVD